MPLQEEEDDEEEDEVVLSLSLSLQLATFLIWKVDSNDGDALCKWVCVAGWRVCEGGFVGERWESCESSGLVLRRPRTGASKKGEGEGEGEGGTLQTIMDTANLCPC